MTQFRLIVLSSIAIAIAIAWTSASAAPAVPTTLAEQSEFRKTGRYDEVVRLCAAYQLAYPKWVRCLEFGRSPEGRPLLALVASRTGALTPADARTRALPVLLVQGGIHAGEIDGKDAGFLALRQALATPAGKGALDRQVLVFVPVFNVDGHERFGRWNRPNQIGPEEMGWRTTAQNYNLNRDYMKADAPEMRAMLGLIKAWDPIATMDLHVTDGAKFEHDISVQVEPLHAGDAGLRTAGKRLSTSLLQSLASAGSLPLAFYPSFVVTDDPTSGFADSVSPPRFSTGYFLLRNRFGLLVETHSWKDYATRVRAMRNSVLAMLEQTAAHGREWLRLAEAADRQSATLGGAQVPLDYLPSAKTRTIPFRGYRYTRTPSPVSGAMMTRYDDTSPQVWHVPIRDDIQPNRQERTPAAGYLVSAAHAEWVAAKLEAHGVEYRSLAARSEPTSVEVFRATKTTFAAQSVEGHQRLDVEGAWTVETRGLGAGALFVPIAQSKARLVVALLEPRAPDSLLAWGAFNNAFEPKEYMEEYVAEDVAREMLARDPALAAEFAAKLRDDKDFAKSSAARLQFFARRHASWDERFNLYPVMRTATVP